jgi:Tfp pilus assembly protein PilO
MAEELLSELEEKKKEKKKTNYFKLAKIYVLPIFSIILFLVIIIGFVIPKASQILSQLNEISELDQQINAEKAEVTALTALDSQINTINSDLAVLNQLAPTGNTEVTKFQKKISDLVVSIGLASTNERGNDSEVDNIDVQNRLTLKEIPNQFELQGTLDQMFTFIAELSKLQDFIIVQNLELDRTNTDIWVMNITLVKYQFGNVTEDLVQSFMSVPLSQQIDADVQDYIDARKVEETTQESESGENVNDADSTEILVE